MRHARADRRLAAYLDDELAPTERAAVERHLFTCERCQEELEALRRTVGLLRGLPDPEPRPELLGAVLDRVADDAGEPFYERLGAWLRPLVPATAAGVLGLGLLVLGGELRAPSPSNPLAFQAAEPAGSAPAPLALRRQPGGAPILGLAAAPAPAPALAAGPSPPTRCRVGGAPAQGEACARWAAWFVDKALRDAPGFVVEVDQLERDERDAWLRHVSALAARSGAAPLIEARLRRTPDPRARAIAPRFSGSHASPSHVQRASFDR